MTAPTPLSKANHLIDMINKMLLDGVSAEIIEEIVSDANRMKDAGQHNEAYNVLGMVAAIRGDIGEVDRLFKAAILCGGRDPWTLSNYAAALSNLDRHTQAIRIIDEVVELVPDNLSLVKEAINLHKQAYDVDGVRELMTRCESLGQPFDDPTMERKLEMIEALMREYNVTWAEVASRTELAAGALHEFGVNPRISLESVADGILMHEFKIDGDVELISRAEDAMNNAIAEESYSRVDDFMYFSCSKV